MSPQDDPVRLHEEQWAAESPFVGEADEEEQARIHPWYRSHTPFVEGWEEMYAPEAGWESDLTFEDEFAFEEPGIIAGENRVRVKKTDGVPWRWICKVVIRDNQGRYSSGGTGVLISDRHVLTAAHVVYPEYIDPMNYSVEVIPALNEGDEPFGAYSLSAQPKIPKNYDPKAQDHLDWDYALITLKDRVGEKTFSKLGGGPLCYWGHPTCGANTIFVRPEPRTLNGRAVLTAGYPNSKGFDPRRGGTQLWSAAGMLHSADQRRRKMGITADTTRGQSGSPVWVVENGRYCLVGIAAGAGKQTNFVVRVTRELIRQLRAWITEDGETPSIIETEEALESPALTPSYPEAEHYEPPAAEWSPGTTAEEAEDFTSSDYEEDELELLREQPLEERFDPSAVPKPWAVGIDPFPAAPTVAFDFSDDRMMKAFAPVTVSSAMPLCTALVDLTGDPATPPYAGLYDNEMIFAGSLPKICAMYAAFALRARVQAFVDAAKANGAPVAPPGITSEIEKAWKPKLRALFPARPAKSFGNNQDVTFPKLGQILTFSPDGKVDFKRATPPLTDAQIDRDDGDGALEGMFHDWMRSMLRWSNNAAASKCILALGYFYLNGALARAGLFDAATNKGLWLSADYKSHDWVKTEADRQANSAGPLLAPRWATAQRRRRSNITATAAQVARFMTLLAQNKLVDATASDAMRALMKADAGGLGSDANDALRGVGRVPSLVIAKFGRGDDSFDHECALIERTVAGKDLRYVAVGLGHSPRRSSQNWCDLFVLLDETIVTRNK